MTEEQQRLELYKLALNLRTYQATLQSQADFTAIKDVLSRVQTLLNKSVDFSDHQRVLFLKSFFYFESVDGFYRLRSEVHVDLLSGNPHEQITQIQLFVRMFWCVLQA